MWSMGKLVHGRITDFADSPIDSKTERRMPNYPIAMLHFQEECCR
jgi:hypothetical protein